MRVDFSDIGIVEDKKLEYAVIAALIHGKWIYVRHKQRKSWEIPGGHREPGEIIDDTAKRELFEETGALEFKLHHICDYSVTNQAVASYGRLCYAEVTEIGELPESEIGEVRLFEDIPALLTYPEIQPILHSKVLEEFQRINKDTVDRLTRNFKLRNIEVCYFEDLSKAKEEIFNLIPKTATVGVGHSATLQEMKVTESLLDRGNNVLDKELANTKEECTMIKKKALLSDWYITGSNAISVDGRIVNIDHSGNRVAAISYGPDNVIIVVGINKVVETLDEAITRAKNIASPLNAKRAGFKPPCVELGKCIDCTSTQRVCNNLSIIEGQAVNGRMRIFVVNEEVGF